MSTNDDSLTQQQLQEDNYVLRTQVTKLQVALKNALNRQKEGSHSPPEGAYVSKQQFEVVLGELAELRLQVGQLHEENRSLQAQLQQVREVQTASGSSSGVPEVLDIFQTAAPDVDPVTRSDMVFIEREINSLKQKISETRLKLQSVQPTNSDDDDDYRAALVGDRRALQRQPMHRKQIATSRAGGGPAARHANAIGLSLFNDLLPRAITPLPSSAAGSAVPSAVRSRFAHGQANKRMGNKHAANKENSGNNYAGANMLGRQKGQRTRGFAF